MAPSISSFSQMIPAHPRERKSAESPVGGRVVTPRSRSAGALDPPKKECGIPLCVGGRVRERITTKKGAMVQMIEGKEISLAKHKDSPEKQNGSISKCSLGMNMSGGRNAQGQTPAWENGCRDGPTLMTCCGRSRPPSSTPSSRIVIVRLCARFRFVVLAFFFFRLESFPKMTVTSDRAYT
ncbi:hypothetical protein NPIL_469681 [Nephila pilipes]|uniref:Uncharacterized protein n=1 Tax=Nephila pilipes TaxID=299642 RepID=A0A8X6NG07_NEPPI|nr:hypothetical protein NPIL_469681 [Nephila pilipes]